MSKNWTKVEINFLLKCREQGMGRKSISKAFFHKFKYGRSPNSVRHAIDLYDKSPKVIIAKKQYLPKTLILDIETAPMKVWAWGLFDQNIGLNQIKEDWYVLSWTAKWIDSDEVIYKDQRGKKGKALYNDKALLKPLWKLMDEADVIITQNGIKFDIKKLNAKFLENDMGKPAEFKQIDTLRLAKKYFSFTSNKLEYMSEKFNTTYKKQAHKEYPGFALWEECMAGNPHAWECMERYNKFDVLSTEELFLKLATFDKTALTESVLNTYRNKK